MDAIKGYELREQIGTGGFGAVYRAFQTTVGREVAVKIILPNLASQPDFIRRFEGEAQLVARLEHPHIVPLHDYWRDPDGAYLVMRWLRGGSLREALLNGPFELRAAALLLDQLAGALSLAHRNNVIHRDIKPGNILLDEDGNAYLTDFGIAKDLNLSGSGTQPDAIIGSLDYISPEQARSEPVTSRTDIYSLGVTMYEVISGHHPFPNLSTVERLYKHINDPLPEIATLEPSVSSEVNRVIQKVTAKNPDHRYPDALAFAADFREAIGLNRTPTTVIELLTQREHEILHLIIEGMSNKEIAQHLTVTLGTVKWYINQIYGKLGVRSRVQAIIRARELNLIGGESHAVNDGSFTTSNLPAPENPYKGLRAFQAADEQDFFGREELTQKLVNRMGKTAASRPHPQPLPIAMGRGEGEGSVRFLAVVGPSGSGKSSVVKAGLIPALWRGDLPGSERWFVAEMLPGAHPLDRLEVALIRVAANQARNLNEQLTRDQRGLLRVADLILPNDGSELVLVIDQFEEVFTLVEDEAERQQFLNLLIAAVTDTRSRVRVVVTLRADFYDRPLNYPEFGDLVRSHMETVLPLSAKGLERAISGPAQRVGVRFEEGLVSSIVAEMNYQAGALPLLQYALTELFERRDGRVLTQQAYQEIGGAVGALAKRAEELFNDLSPEGQEVARQMFLRLVTLGEGVEDTRRRTPRTELMAIGVIPTPNPSPLRREGLQTPPLYEMEGGEDLMDEILDTYAAYRLLTLDNDLATRTPTVELAHEAMLREWERLRGWLNESRHEIRLQRQLAAMAADWREASGDRTFLAHGSRLEQFEMWAKDTKLALTPEEHDYLNTSLAERERQAEVELERQARETALERRSIRFLRALVGVLLLATLAAFGLVGVAVNQSQIAERNAAEAQNIALISGSQAALANGNTDQAIALALEAVTLDPGSAGAQVALSQAAYAPGTIRTFVGHADPVDEVALSPDGRMALSASGDGTLILWDIQTGEILRRFEGHTGGVTSVAFTPDGLTAISGSRDTTLIQWDIQTGTIIRRFEGQPDEIWAVAISPDGLTVTSGGSGNNMILWDIQTGEMIRSFEGHTAGIESIEFSADGSQLLSASDDRTVILWDVATGQIIQHFEGATAPVYRAIFSPDNRTLLSSDDDSWMIIWDIETGQIIRRLFGGGPAVIDIAFSPDGRAILAGGVGGLTLWNIETAQPISRLLGHAGFVNSLVFSADGRTALSASGDGTLRLWDLEAGQMIRRFNSAGEGVWWGLAASPDGQIVVAGFGSHSHTNVILWDVNTGAEIRRYSTDEYVNDIAFSPDGQTALLGIDKGGPPSDMILWDVNTGAEIRRFSGHPGGISGVAFNPDGRAAASAGWDNTIILWEVATGAEIRRFQSEDPDSSGAWASVEFSPDGQMLVATAYDGAISMWEVATGKEIRQFVGDSRDVRNFVFSADGQQGFSGSGGGTAILWDVDTGAILRRFSGHSAAIPRVDMSSDERLGIAGSADNTTTLWDLNSGELIRRYDTGPYASIFAPDNRTAVVAYPSNVELWRIDATLDELLTWTQANRYIPDLTCDQRTLYRVEPLCEEENVITS